MVELKDALWTEVIDSSGDLSMAFDRWKKEVTTLEDDIKKRLRSVIVQVPAFSASIEDITKMIDEVEFSCLDKACKDSFMAALKTAKEQVIKQLSTKEEKK